MGREKDWEGTKAERVESWLRKQQWGRRRVITLKHLLTPLVQRIYTIHLVRALFRSISSQAFTCAHVYVTTYICVYMYIYNVCRSVYIYILYGCVSFIQRHNLYFHRVDG